MTSIFISYSHKDSEIVIPIVEELDKTYNCWIDKDISYGSKWRNEITTAITKSSVVLYFVSNNSVISEECIKEIELSIKLNKKIIPIIIEEVNCNYKLVKEINELQWIYLDDIYKLFTVLKNKPLTIIELTVLFNSFILLILLYLSLIT